MSKIRPARAALRAWLSVRGQTQCVLADAIGVAQQTVSHIVRGQEPSEEIAKLIEEATGIGWRGWYSEAELRRRETAQEARISRARALRSAVSAVV
jgi:transcriptional regulator with XRE-family HTH domain